jgi:hypothetical protein
MTFVSPTIADEKSLQALTRRPVLGGVSVALDALARHATRMQVLRFAGISIAFLALNSAWVGWVLTGGKI